MIQFTPDLMTNVEIIDQQHKALIECINEIVAMGVEAAGKEKIEKSLLFLGNYVIKHFHDEEEVQLQVGYPKYEQHRREHQDFVENYKAFVADYRERGPSIDFMLRLNRAVIRWIVQHIQDSDLDLAYYIRENNLVVH
jgi:hemerythrin-like metal-binding domain